MSVTLFDVKDFDQKTLNELREKSEKLDLDSICTYGYYFWKYFKKNSPWKYRSALNSFLMVSRKYDSKEKPDDEGGLYYNLVNLEMLQHNIPGNTLTAEEIFSYFEGKVQENPHPLALLGLAQCYELGIYVQKNLEKASHFYTQLALFKFGNFNKALISEHLKRIIPKIKFKNPRKTIQNTIAQIKKDMKASNVNSETFNKGMSELTIAMYLCNGEKYKECYLLALEYYAGDMIDGAGRKVNLALAQKLLEISTENEPDSHKLKKYARYLKEIIIWVKKTNQNAAKPKDEIDINIGIDALEELYQNDMKKLKEDDDSENEEEYLERDKQMLLQQKQNYARFKESCKPKMQLYGIEEESKLEKETKKKRDEDREDIDKDGDVEMEAEKTKNEKEPRAVSKSLPPMKSQSNTLVNGHPTAFSAVGKGWSKQNKRTPSVHFSYTPRGVSEDKPLSAAATLSDTSPLGNKENVTP